MTEDDQSQKQSSGDNSQNIQAGRDAHVNISVNREAEEPSIIRKPTDSEVVKYNPKLQNLLRKIESEKKMLDVRDHNMLSVHRFSLVSIFILLLVIYMVFQLAKYILNSLGLFA